MHLKYGSKRQEARSKRIVQRYSIHIQSHLSINHFSCFLLLTSSKEGQKKGREKSRPMKDQSNLIFVLHLFLMLLDQCLLDIVRHELIA